MPNVTGPLAAISDRICTVMSNQYCPHFPIQSASFHHLKPLPLNLLLGSIDSGLRIGVDKVTTGLAILEGSRLSRTYANAGSIGAALGRTIGVVDTAAGNELGALLVADVAATGEIGCDLAEGGGGDCYGWY